MLYLLGIFLGIYVGSSHDTGYFIGGVVGFIFAYVIKLNSKIHTLEQTIKSIKNTRKEAETPSSIDLQDAQTCPKASYADDDLQTHNGQIDPQPTASLALNDGVIKTPDITSENNQEAQDKHIPSSIKQEVYQQTAEQISTAEPYTTHTFDSSFVTDDTAEINVQHPTEHTADQEHDDFTDQLPTHINHQTNNTKKPALLAKAFKKAQSLAIDYFTGGNSLVRVGLLVLFIGIAFLLKYVAERTTVPIEFRYIGILLGSLIMMILGWKLKNKRPGYAISMLGSGIGVLYLTLFAAMRLHGLLSPETVILLLIATVFLSAGLAILADSMALAVIGMIGGYAAPILTSTGSGSHVHLFSYYLLLNTGVFFIAWFKSWRILNVVGFIATFGIGSIWGYQYYKTAYLWSVEPFLIISFLMYTFIALIFAMKQKPHLKGINDGTLIFGTPLVGFALQAALMKDTEYGLAYSALALGAFYSGLSFILYKMKKAYLKDLYESFIALAIGFATLAIPLAFDGRVTSAMWVAEGSALVWVGIRQTRLLPRLSGYALTLLGALMFFIEKNPNTDLIPLLNADYIGVLIISIASTFMGLYAHRNAHKLPTIEQYMVPRFMMIFSLIWWLFGGIHEINHFFTNVQFSLFVVFLIFTTTLLLFGAKRFSFDLLKDLSIIVTCSALMMLIITPKLDHNTALLFNNRFIGLMLISLFHFVMSWHWREEKGSADLGAVNWLLILLLSSSMLNWLYAFTTEIQHFTPLYAFIWIEILMALTAVLLLFFGIKKQHHAYQLASAAVVLLMCIPMTLTSSFIGNGVAVFNVSFMGYMIYTLTHICMAWYWQRSGHEHDTFTDRWYMTISNCLLVLGLMAWFIRGLFEISDYAPTQFIITFVLIFIAASILGLILMAQKLNWRSLHLIKYTHLIALVLIAMHIIIMQKTFHQGFGLFAWLVAATLHLWILRIYEKSEFAYLNLYHIIGLSLGAVILLSEGAELAMRIFATDSIWHHASHSLILIIICTLLYIFRNTIVWPISSHQKAYIKVCLPTFVMIAWLMTFIVNIIPPGTLKSLPYIPILNPIDIAGLITLVLSGVMLKNNAKTFFIKDHKKVMAILALLGFLLLNASMLRCFHYWYDIEYNTSAMFSSFIIQTGFSILWTLTAVILMIISSRKGWRKQWLAALGLIVVVVAKLFLIDMSASGSIERIVAFLTVGILLSIVGYFSPLPPDNDNTKNIDTDIVEQQ